VNILPDTLDDTRLTNRSCGAIVSNEVPITAIRAFGATHYTFAFYNDAACTEFVDSVRLNTPSLIIASHIPSLDTGIYHVKVRASRLQSGNWLTGLFSTACAVDYRTFTSVPNTRLAFSFRNASGTYFNAVPVAGATQYTFAIYNDQACTELRGTYHSSGVRLNTLPAPEGEMYVKVRASIGSLQGTYGVADKFTFSTAPTTRTIQSGEAQEAPETLVVYPNPSRGTVNVALAADEPVTLLIYRGDVEVAQYAFNGGFSTQIELGEEAGLYIVKAISSKGTTTQKIVVAK
jgi:hypothetical protein